MAFFYYDKVRLFSREKPVSGMRLCFYYEKRIPRLVECRS
jgi:hypothetical protein